MSDVDIGTDFYPRFHPTCSCILLWATL